MLNVRNCTKKEAFLTKAAGFHILDNVSTTCLQNVYNIKCCVNGRIPSIEVHFSIEKVGGISSGCPGKHRRLWAFLYFS